MRDSCDPRDYYAREQDWRRAPADSPLAQCKDALAQAINARAIRHGDLPRWQAVLDALPPGNGLGVTVVDGIVSVGQRESDAEQKALHNSLMQLCPWRKGPFDIGGVHIDTEWRSDWKWDRVLPALSSLQGRHVMDIGCGSGYHLWRMREQGAASVLGVEPMLLYQHQFDVVQHFAQDPAVNCVPLTLEQLPAQLPAVDTVFSMGVLYHAHDPHQHLRRLLERLRAGGEVVLETLVADDAPCPLDDACELDREIVIEDRYARMHNIHRLPSTQRVQQWMVNAGFTKVRLISQQRTSTDEQRSTDWMPFESLKESLDPSNSRLTVEGLPAPCRAIFVANKHAAE